MNLRIQEKWQSSDFVVRHFADSRRVLEEACSSREFALTLVSIAATITASLTRGGRLYLAGNGGSAGDAQHIAGEFLSRLNYDRAPLPAIALTTDSSVLTAIGNDYGYDCVFERQIRGLSKKDDVFIAISTSGRSPNIVARLTGRTGDRDHNGRFYGTFQRSNDRALRSRAARSLRVDRR